MKSEDKDRGKRMYNHGQHYLYAIKELGDERGGLAVINSGVETPFNIERVFYNYNTIKNTIRGNHANSKSSFVIISLAGSCLIEIDDGMAKEKYILDSPTKALYIGRGLWKTMKNFSKDNILLILSDCIYDETEYIRNYSEYLKTINFKEE